MDAKCGWRTVSAPTRWGAACREARTEGAVGMEGLQGLEVEGGVLVGDHRRRGRGASTRVRGGYGRLNGRTIARDKAERGRSGGDRYRTHGAGLRVPRDLTGQVPLEIRLAAEPFR